MRHSEYAIVGLVIGLVATGCTGVSRELVCAQSAECVRDGADGVCMPPGHCAFTDMDCGSGFRWDGTAAPELAGQCMDAAGTDAGPGDFDSGTANGCGGTAVLTGQPGSSCGICDSGSFVCDGSNAVRCDGALALSVPVSPASVSASSQFNGSFDPELSTDLDESTSWFSAGVEAAPSEYRWNGAQDDCIENIRVVNNINHSNSDFRVEFGFGQVTVQVLDGADAIVFSETVSLAGSPDPEVNLSPGVRGRRVRLLLTGHEQGDCGGFSELYVTAKR